ncbi:WD-repeat protein 37 [Aphelenchoides avenae]|nr:WD-repeat protein 37 [Aphelenchus avenae]
MTNQRGRSHTDSAIGTIASSFDTADADGAAAHKAKLYELFALIEKEFEALYVENCALRSRLEGQQPEKYAAEYAPASPADVVSPSSAELVQRAVGKKPQMRQKWKTAFRGPPGRLVTSLKVGAGADSSSKHCFVRHFDGHQDGVWHVSTHALPSLKLIASASADQTAKLWSADTGQCLLSYTGHSGSVNSIAIHPECSSTDQITVLTAGGDRTAHVWKTVLQSGGSSEDDLDEKLAGAGPVEPEGHVIPSTLRQPLLRFTGHTDVIVASEWLVGGEQLMTASWDRTANIYDAESGKILNVLSGHDQELTHCNAHNSQKLVATASKDFTFRLWDFRETIQSVAVFQGHNDAVTSVVFSASHHIVSGSDDRTVKVWDLRNMRSPISAIRLNSPANRLAISHKYNLIGIPLDNRHVCAYDLHGQRVARMPRANGRSHRRMACCAAWMDSPTINLVTCSFDKTIIGWKVPIPNAKG